MPTLYYAASSGSQLQNPKYYPNEYWKQIGREIVGTKLMKIRSGYYDSPASLEKYSENEFEKESSYQRA